MNQRHITGIGLFALIGAGSVLAIITVAGGLEPDLRDAAVRCGALGGAFVGYWTANRLRSREPKHIVGLGAAAGVLLHPVMWFFFINYQSIQDQLPTLEYLSEWTNVLNYSLASLPQGGAVTLPLSLAGVWLLARRVSDEEHQPDVNPSDSASSSDHSD